MAAYLQDFVTFLGAFWNGILSGEASSIWTVVGFIAQAMFFGRFFVQWIASERQRRSIIPIAFWYFSLAGGSLLLAYAIYRQDPVFIAGQAGGLVIYLRNLYFIFKRMREEAEENAAIG